MPAKDEQTEAEYAEPVTGTKVPTEMIIRNAVAVVAATLLPIAVFRLPVMCTILLPNSALFALLHTLSLL